jgi:hypothetical protein
MWSWAYGKRLQKLAKSVPIKKYQSEGCTADRPDKIVKDSDVGKEIRLVRYRDVGVIVRVEVVSEVDKGNKIDSCSCRDLGIMDRVGVGGAALAAEWAAPAAGGGGSTSCRGGSM